MNFVLVMIFFWFSFPHSLVQIKFSNGLGICFGNDVELTQLVKITKHFFGMMLSFGIALGGSSSKVQAFSGSE